MVQKKKKTGTKLRTKFKIILFLILLALIILLLKELMELKINQDLIIKRVNIQTEQITTLNAELYETQSKLTLEQLRTYELQQQVAYLNGEQTAVVTNEKITEEKEKVNSFDTLKDPMMLPIVAVGILQILKSVVFRIPSF